MINFPEATVILEAECRRRAAAVNTLAFRHHVSPHVDLWAAARTHITIVCAMQQLLVSYACALPPESPESPRP